MTVKALGAMRPLTPTRRSRSISRVSRRAISTGWSPPRRALEKAPSTRRSRRCSNRWSPIVDRDPTFDNYLTRWARQMAPPRGDPQDGPVNRENATERLSQLSFARREAVSPRRLYALGTSLYVISGHLSWRWPARAAIARAATT